MNWIMMEESFINLVHLITRLQKENSTENFSSMGYIIMHVIYRSKIDAEHGGNLKEETLFQLAGRTLRRRILRRSVAREEAPPDF